tara:strand:- start:304 stop:693 length:390 start_codon:yes stop_codon:yes gene_type:complete
MRAALLALFAVLATSNAQAASASIDPDGKSDRLELKCEAGPAERYFEKVQWLVYACDDEASIIIITGPKSPQDLSFYFLVYPSEGTYKLVGEGNGDEDLTQPAYQALSAMSADDIRALYAEAALAGQTP